MKTKWQMGLIFLIFWSVQAYAQDSTTIEIQKVDGRTEALVPVQETVTEPPTGFFAKSFYSFETSVLKVAQLSSSAAGKVTDSAVWGIQRASDVLFAPIIKTLDVRQWRESV